MSGIYIPERSEELPEKFFERDSESVAKSLLGRTLVRERKGGENLYASIKEVASYEGKLMSSRYKGLLYSPGTIFVPVQFGNPILGLATDKIGEPSGITFISAMVGERGKERELVNGPGNLTKALEIDKDSFDGMHLKLSPIWVGSQPVESGRILKRNNSNIPDNCTGYFYFRK